MTYKNKVFYIEAFRVGYDPVPSWFQNALFLQVCYPTNPPEFCYFEVVTSELMGSSTNRACKGDWVIRHRRSMGDFVYGVFSDEDFHKYYEKECSQ